MGVFDYFINSKIQKAVDSIEAENKRASLSKKETSNNKLKDFIIKTVGFINSYGGVGRDVYSPAEYDFEEIKMAAEADSYIKSSLDKYKRLVHKAGYYLKSENQEAVEYLETRFRVMSYATGKPMDILFQEIADDLITYSNCILIKTRVKKVMPGIRAVGFLNDDPIGGYSRVDPATISIKRDEHGNVLEYIQHVSSGKEKKYKTSDVIHMYMDKESSNAFGTPKIIAALEDVKLLRKLEGNVLAIVHRFAIPIFHWKIGKALTGFQANSTEIDEAKREIEGMSLDGVVITNEKTEISVIGAEGAAINASEYLKYFEDRVFTALDTSASQMGRGGARQDADSMEAQSHDYIKFVQRVISIFSENTIMSELLMEGGFNPILNKGDIVEYIFNEISLETKIKLENHEMLKYQSNMQSLEEGRRNIGYKDEVDEKRLYKNLIEVPAQIAISKGTAEAQTESQIKVAKVNATLAPKTPDTSSTSSKTGNLSNGKKASQSPSKAATTNNRPTNQHGTTSVKVKEAVDLVEKVVRNKQTHKKKYNEFYSKIEKLRNNLIETEGDLDYLFSISVESLTQDLKTMINYSSLEGIERAKNDLSKMNVDITDIASLSISLSFLHDQAHLDIKNVFKDIKKRLNGNREASNVDATISALEYRFRFLIEYVLPKAEWYSYVEAGKRLGIEKAKIIFGDSTDAENHNEYLNLKSYGLEDIPAFHPFCDCKVKLIKE